MAKPITIENADIAFRNFAGREGQYNAEGDRNFCIILDQENADILANAGWNVKELKARDEGEAPRFYIQVSVNFKGKPPKLSIVNSKGRTIITEAECEVLDWVDIKQADVILNPYEWTVNGKSGIKAYLKNLVIVMDEDELDLKYGDVPVVGEENEESGL